MSSEWHQPMSPETKAQLGALQSRGADGEMRSIGEVLSGQGFVPSGEVPAEQPWTENRVRELQAEFWATQRPKIFPALRAAGIPGAFVALLETPEKINETEAIREVEQWDRTGELLLVLGGINQIGKSFACAYALSRNSVVRRSRYGNEPSIDYRYVDTDFAWIYAPEFAALKDRFDSDVRIRARRLQDCRTLVIDDVGAGSLADVSKQIEQLLVKRVGERRRTLLTTNCTGKALEDAVGGERVLSRIRSVGGVIEVGPGGQKALPL